MRLGGKCSNFFKTSCFAYVWRLPLRVKTENAISQLAEVDGGHLEISHRHVIGIFIE